ncbi:hypothetical protein JCGZ_10706 [Jatropha curcas]|uniref:Cytochrome P450 n=2 Tax=Jatropha curcas TaxID=180498 RepID=A0A067KGC6_JATCU|nr:hypothetical protein JCGZ_10706 [Jatropha curcas]
MTITDPELIKEVLSNKYGFYVRSSVRPTLKTLVGKQSLIFVEGHDWLRQRKLLNPAFSIDKLKIMTKKMADCTIAMLEGWKNQPLEAYKETQCMKIEMSQEFIKLTYDIIAHTAFGSSYGQGKEAFNAQKELQKCCVAANSAFFIPGSQYLPTPSNIRIWKLDSLMKSTLRGIIEKRLRSKDSTKNYGDDLLGTMINGYSEIAGETKLSVNEILENCKAFFFAGHETTSSLLTWTIFMLSLHREWQERLRIEVLKECSMEIPDADMLAKLKWMNMVLLETLRLYSPIINLLRVLVKDTKLGNLMIPKGTCIQIPVTKVHRSKEYWGEDADAFNPFRFGNGVSKAAKHPNAFIGFGMGPRVCIGQSFAMVEAKIVLALILQRFSLSLSPEYKHTPINHITLHPQYGLPIIVKPLS